MASRDQLIARAFPAADIRARRARLATTSAAAATLAIAGAWPIGVVLLLAALPLAVRHVRQQLALGALIADDDRRRRDGARLPDRDLRTTFPGR